MLDLIDLLFVSAAAGSWPAALVLCVLLPVGLPLLAGVALVAGLLCLGVAAATVVALGYLVYEAWARFSG